MPLFSRISLCFQIRTEGIKNTGWLVSIPVIILDHYSVVLTHHFKETAEHSDYECGWIVE